MSDLMQLSPEELNFNASSTSMTMEGGSLAHVGQATSMDHSPVSPSHAASLGEPSGERSL